MKLNRLETHDRLLHLKEDQTKVIEQGLYDCMNKNDLSLRYQAKSPYIYIFMHPRTHDNGVDKVLMWQPRLRKPNAQTNSQLFRVKSFTEDYKVCWMIPDETLWGQYKKGNITEHDHVEWSIFQYQTNKKALEEPHPDDWSKDQVDAILLQIATEKDQEAKNRKIYVKPKLLEPFPSSLIF